MKEPKMKDKDGKTVKLGDPVLVERQSGILSGYIVAFSKNETCCHVSCGGKTYKKVYSREITFWK